MGFNKAHVKVLVDARALEFSRVHAKVFNKDVKDFQGCIGCGVQQGACLGTACSGQGCGPTPSIESLHFVWSLASRRALRLKGLDVSHAFMHSPLPEFSQ